VEKPAKFRGPG